MENFLALCNRVKAETGIAGNALITVLNQTGEAADLVEWVRAATLQIEAEHVDWKFLWRNDFEVPFVYPMGSRQFPIEFDTQNVNVWDVESFFLDRDKSSYVHLDYIDYDVYKSSYRLGVVSQGTPIEFTIDPLNKILVPYSPAISKMLTAEYWVRAKKLVNNTDQPNIPYEYRRIIVARAKMYYAAQNEAGEQYQSAMSEYQECYAKIINTFLPGRDHLSRTQAAQMVVTVR